MYEEHGQSQGLTRWLKYLLLCGLLFWGYQEWGPFVKRDYQGFRGIVYVVCMVLFWFWLYGFSYTVQVDKNEIRILRILLGRVTRTFVIRKAEIDGIMNQFSRKTSYGHGVRQFIHQYSWADDRIQKTIFYRKDSGKTVKAVIVKGSPELLEVFKKNFPREFIENIR